MRNQNRNNVKYKYDLNSLTATIHKNKHNAAGSGKKGVHPCISVWLCALCVCNLMQAYVKVSAWDMALTVWKK